MNLYEFVDFCREEGLSASEAHDEWDKYCAEKKEQFLEDYYNDPMVQAGWAQQDVIDMYRRER